MQEIKYKENKNFHTTLINFVYQFKCNKEDIMALTLYCILASKTNKEYNDEISFAKEKLNRYIISYSVKNQSINDIYFINFSLLIPSDNVIKEDYLEKSILFLLDSVFKPNIEDENLFIKEKRIYTEYLLNAYKNIEFIAEKNLLDLLDQDCIFNKLKYRDIENINTLNIKDIINFYNKYIKNIKPIIFINGNINNNKVEKIINDYTKDLNLKEQKLINKYNNFYKIQKSIYKTDKSKFYQSIIYLIYNIKNYKEEDFYKLYLINLLLSSSSSDLLLENLRKKNNLVYSCGASAMLKNGLLFIKVITNKDNVKLAKLVITELINDLNNIEKYEKNINNIINKLELNIERELDNFYILCSNEINSYFKADITRTEELKILKNIKLEDLKELISRINLVCDYSLEGEL